MGEILASQNGPALVTDLAANRDTSMLSSWRGYCLGKEVTRGKSLDGQQPEVCAPSVHPHPLIFHMIEARYIPALVCIWIPKLNSLWLKDICKVKLACCKLTTVE